MSVAIHPATAADIAGIIALNADVQAAHAAALPHLFHAQLAPDAAVAFW
ncbi:hypothetical protein GTZ99_01045 [Novosphingobium sp. FSY-8]|uniref:GNAT family N-acetyltransferase n=1 Tax=Novosphingobium ovatum TaxID=1908523 RepID=A0ABW9X9C8_9SPHN|nr:hypothetical protein [Novosphingobium ovatum]NBC35140.1 hypothetical protein [Novosphingobium ovatum]